MNVHLHVADREKDERDRIDKGVNVFTFTLLLGRVGTAKLQSEEANQIVLKVQIFRQSF